MTDDDLRARFDEITSGEELNSLRKARHGFWHHAKTAALVAAALTFIALVLWLLIHAAAWAGNHGMLPAPH